MTNRTPVVAEYLDFVKVEDLEGATTYLQECFMNTETNLMDEEAMSDFQKEIIATAEAEVAAAETPTAEASAATTQAEVANDNAEAAAVQGSEDTAAEATVQEVTSES